MGCKQTTTKSPSLVFATSPTASTAPVYVKSALKTPRANGRGKTERLLSSKRKQSTVNKSVNFDEKVRVKLRTPTPKETRYENQLSANSRTRQTSDNDDNNNNEDDDDQLSLVSSQDEIRNEQLKTSTISSNQNLQRNQPNGFWYKNNAVAAVPPTNNTREKPQQPSVNMPRYSPDNLNLPVGNRFRVRRKPQTSNTVDPNQSPTITSYRTSVQSSPVPVQRPLSNTNTVLIEHRAPLPNDGSSPQTAYYAFSRRPNDKTNTTEQ